MRDRQTDSWWSIMTGKAIGGPEDGTRLKELPLGEKTTWKRWVAKHPDTLVLSIDGKEDDQSDPYANYFNSDGTFRGAKVDDDRLPPKEPVYSFEKSGKDYALPNRKAEGGLLVPFPQDGVELFFYREPGLSLFGSTFAVATPPGLFIRQGKDWVFRDGKKRWTISDTADPDARDAALQRLTELEEVQRLGGFDTFWYTWIAAHPSTTILP